MSQIVLTRGQDGKLCGAGEKAERAYAKFRARVDRLSPGDTLHFEWREPRSLPHHRLFFAKLNALSDRQERFGDVDELRTWLTVGAGYCDFRPGPNGGLIAIPKSIAFHKLDETEFSELHARVDAFLWSDHARKYLWPHLTDAQSWDLVGKFQLEFSK